LELKLQSRVLVTAFGSRRRRIKGQVCIQFFIGDDYFEHVLLVSGQLIESSLIGADFLLEYELVLNFKTNCLVYEMEGNMKERRFTNKAAAWLEPQENMGHGLPGTADHDVTQTINDESVWTTRKYVAFANKIRELYDEMMEEEINPSDISVKRDMKRNAACMS